MLQRDVEVIENTLAGFGVVNRTAVLEHYAERSALRESRELGVAWERTFEFGVREDGRPALEVKWTQKILSTESAEQSS